MKRWLPVLLFSICACAAVVIAVMWVTQALEHAGYENLYEEIAEEARAYAPSTTRMHENTFLDGSGIEGDVDASAEPQAATHDEAAPDMERQDHSLVSAAIDFAMLSAQNPDTRAWIRIDGTKIDYPVVQGESNARYLDIGFNGKSAKCGTLFFDYQNAAQDRNLIVYGHNMRSSTLMFSQLLNYKKGSYLSSHPTISLVLPDGEILFDIIAVCHLDIKTLDTFNFLQMDFATDDSFAAYADAIKGKSLYNTGISTNPSSRLITLVTCDRSLYGEDGRVIVVGQAK